MNLAGTGMLQDEQFNVEPWWKASVVVKVSTIVARQTGDLLLSRRWMLSQGIGDTCSKIWLHFWHVPSSLRVTMNPGLRGRFCRTVSRSSQVSSICAVYRN